MTMYKDNQSIISTHATAKWSDEIPILSEGNIKEIQKIIDVSEISKIDFLNRIYAKLISSLVILKSYKGKKLPTIAKEEIDKLQQAHEKYLDTISNLSSSTKDLINNEIMSDQIKFDSYKPNYLQSYEESLQDNFFVIQKAIENIDITAMKSRDSSILQNTIDALAKWYELETGVPPKRSFDGMNGEESGKFLKLINFFITCLPDDLQISLPSNPSGIVRQTLKDMADKS